MWFHIEFCLPEKPPTPNNIGVVLKGNQRQLCREDLFLQYEKDKHFSLLSDLVPIKSLPEGTKVLCSLIYNIITEGYWSDAWTFFGLQCANEISQIQGIGFDKSYSPVAYSESFIINIGIVAIYRLTARILDINNAFQNKHFPIHERVCVIPPTYYIDWFERSYPNVPINLD